MAACPSGNCTWPIFVSLGVCSNCRDVSAYVQRHSDCRTNQPSMQHQRLFKRPPQLLEDNETTCNYGFPPLRNGNVRIHNGSDPSNGSQNYTITHQSRGDRPVFSVFPVDDGLGSPLEGHWTKSYQIPFDLRDGTSIPSKISSLGLLRTNSQDGRVITAHPCALSFCTRRYNKSVARATVFSETTDTAYSAVSWGPSFTNSSYKFTNGNKTLSFVKVESPDRDPLEYRLNGALTGILQGTASVGENGRDLSPTLKVGDQSAHDCFQRFKGYPSDNGCDSDCYIHSCAISRTPQYLDKRDLWKLTYG